MKPTLKKPFADTRLVRFLNQRILELKPRKTLASIAEEAGFARPNVMSMIKAGSLKLPLDRVPALAAALECDPALLFRMALEQLSHNSTETAIRRIFGVVVSENEAEWVRELRLISDDSDPPLTSRLQREFRRIFGK